MQYYEINEQTARLANDVNSMSDYRPGSATEEYRAAVDKAAALVEERKAKISPYYHDKLDALLDRYARRLADYYNAYYRNESACPSILVCGGSNFPVRKKQKQNARRESLWQEYKEIDAILDKIRSVGTGAVDLTDPHARELLQDRLQQEQNALDYCKAANAYYRKHKTLRGYASLTDQQADALTDPDAFSVKLYGKPYGDFELSSLRGKIKRVQARLADLDKLQAAAQQPDNATKFDGGEIVRNAEENRLQILFDEIPDADTRDALKSNGFRWSPRNKAWQRQLTQNAAPPRFTAGALRGIIDPTQNTKRKGATHEQRKHGRLSAVPPCGPVCRRCPPAVRRPDRSAGTAKHGGRPSPTRGYCVV